MVLLVVRILLFFELPTLRKLHLDTACIERGDHFVWDAALLAVENQVQERIAYTSLPGHKVF